MFKPLSPKALKLSIAVLIGLTAMAAAPVLAIQLGLFEQSEGDIGTLTSPPGESLDPRAVAPVGNLTLEQARVFTGFPLFWVGEEYQGLPLTAIVRADYISAQRPGIEVREDSVTFLYGKCIPPEGEGGCPAPFQVIVQPYCQVPPSLAVDFVRDGPPFQLRGALAQQYTDGHLQLWTGPVSVTVYGPDPTAVRQLAEELRPIDASSPPETLAPPGVEERDCPGVQGRTE